MYARGSTAGAALMEPPRCPPLPSRVRAAAVLGALALASLGLAPAARADDAPPLRQPIVGFRVRGHSKVTDQTASYLAHAAIGDLVGPGDVPRLAEALLSSELFKSVAVTLEAAPGGVLVVATLDDKHSWIVAPTLFLLPGNRAVGFGFAENDAWGMDHKALFYAQLGDRESVVFGTYLDPSVRGTPLTYRVDLYAYQRDVSEYANSVDDATDARIARITTSTYVGGGALVGWRLAWWLVADLRLRGAYVRFRAPHADDASATPLPSPEANGWDVSAQPRLTVDGRHHRFGVTWGPYAQLVLDGSVPGLDDYGYGSALMRAWYSWRLFREHQLEVRAALAVGYHLPLHEEFTLGGVGDLRGYAGDRYRGDRRATGRVEYSVPLMKHGMFAFRGIGFWDTGAVELAAPRLTADRAYLPGQPAGTSWVRNDVGLGLRLYVNAIVLPLLGIDVAYGVEARVPEVYLELGLTDF